MDNATYPGGGDEMRKAGDEFLFMGLKLDHVARKPFWTFEAEMGGLKPPTRYPYPYTFDILVFYGSIPIDSFISYTNLL